MVKKKPTIKEMSCGPGTSGCNFVGAAAIIVLIWVWPSELWAQIVITALAAMIGLSNCGKK